jgi:hypothetical protein
MKVAAGLIAVIAGLLVASSQQRQNGEAVATPFAHGDRCPGMPIRGPGRRAFVVGGRVAFPAASNAPGWEQGDAAQASGYPGNRLFSKTALVIRGAGPVKLRMRAPGEISGWTAREPTTNIELSQGAACAGTGWHWFPGGPLAPRPGQCVKLRVILDSHSKTVPFGVRKPC